MCAPSFSFLWQHSREQVIPHALQAVDGGLHWSLFFMIHGALYIKELPHHFAYRDLGLLLTLMELNGGISRLLGEGSDIIQRGLSLLGFVCQVELVRRFQLPFRNLDAQLDSIPGASRG